MAIVISKTKEEPAVYGANETPVLNSVVSANMIRFGKGSLESVLAHVGEETPSSKVYFGFDDTTGTGAVVTNGKLVSSKILDIIVTKEVKAAPAIEADEKNGIEAKDAVEAVAPKLVVKYADATNKQVSTVELELVSKADVEAALAAVEAKNVAAEGETGDSALVSASADENKVTVASTQKLKDAVAIAEKLDGDDNIKGSVKQQIAALKKEIMTGEATEAVSTAYDTLLEISKFIEANDQLSDTGDIVTAINANTKAIGVASTPASGEEGKEGYVPAVPGTGLTGRVEALEAKKHATSDVSAEEGKYISGIKVAADGAVTITETALPEITIASDSYHYISVDPDNKHKISVKTTALADAVGLTRGTDGKWVAANGSVADSSVPDSSVADSSVPDSSVPDSSVADSSVPDSSVPDSSVPDSSVPDSSVAYAPGLATAADVAAEIIADEIVIAAALNEHEMRIKTLEDADAVHTTVATKTTGHITVATGEGKVVTITEDADAEVTYTEATEVAAANLKVNSTELLLNGSAIAAIKNYVDAVLAAKVSDLEAKLAAETARATNAENALVEAVNSLNSALTWTEV